MNSNIKILLIASYIWYFGEGLFGPLYAIFTQQLGGDLLDITGAFSTYLIVTGILSILIGRVSDKVSKYKLMMSGYIINTLATFGYLFVDSTLKLIIVQIALGIATALATPTWNALFAANIDKKSVGEEYGLSDGGPRIIFGIAVLCGGFIVTYYSFTILFIIMGCVQTVSTIAQACILKK
ncbi:MAG TPA: MFS transporter [Acidobacteriota bacterium]|nr:MFS transporter [Acidobacteriota bacterium]